MLSVARTVLPTNSQSPLPDMDEVFLLTSTSVRTLDWNLPSTNLQYEQTGQDENCFRAEILTHKWNFYFYIIAQIFFLFCSRLRFVRWKGLRCLQGQICKLREENISFSLMLGRRFLFQFFVCILWQNMFQLVRNLTDGPCYKTLSMVCHSTLWTYRCSERRSLRMYIHIHIYNVHYMLCPWYVEW